MIVLRALGTAEIDTGMSTITPSQGILFATALYLILERGNRVSRTHLASLLWPTVAEKARAHRLRQTIHQLKKLGLMVKADRDNLFLPEREVQNDADELSTDGVRALEQHSLAFLPGYSPRFSEPLRDWVDSKRAVAHAAATGILVRELERSRLQADWTTVEKAAAKCLALDEYNETAVLARAEAAAMRGGKREAMSILDRYISEIGGAQSELKLPAALLRRRVVERIPDRASLLMNADPAFVGRESQMEVLTESFGRARAGTGSATLLIGEPGIGKSRLSAELGRFAELQGAAVQRATCRRTDVDRPLSLFVDIVPQLRELPGALGCAPETFASLKRLTEFEQRPGGLAHPGDSEMLFQSVRTALFDLFDSLADERCLVVLIEDIQWLDNASAKILAQMIEWAPARRIFFLLNSRPGMNGLCELAERVPVQTVTLGPLSQTASTTLLRSIALQPSDWSEAGFVSWWLAVAEGNPFFLQELAHHWVETGRRHEAPPSVTRVLQERLARLSSEALQVLQTCAVLGECATIDRVEKVLGYQPHMLLAAIDELSRAAMLISPGEETDSPNGQLQPRHDFLSSAATGRLAPLSLAFIHRRAADVLEGEIAHEAMPTTLLWACANHRHHAGDRERARSLSVSCAEHLLELGLAHEASTAFQRSLEYCNADAQRLKLFPRLALALELDGEWERSKQALSMGIQVFTKQDPTNSQHNEHELLLLGARYRSALDFAPLLEDTLACVGCKEASSVHRVRAAILAMKVAMDFGQVERVDWLYQEVSPILTDQAVNEHDRLELEMIHRTDCGDGMVPMEDLQRFAEVARLLEGELGYSRALITASSACRHSARYHEGLSFVSQAAAHAKSNKLHARQVEISIAAVLLHIAAGEFSLARTALSGAEKCPIRMSNNRVRNEIHCHAARLALEEGDLVKATSEFESIDTPASTFSFTRKGYFLALEIRIRLQQGAPVELIEPIVAELDTNHRRMRGSGAQDFESHALYLGLCALGDEERAATQLTSYVHGHRRCKWPLSKTILDTLESIAVNRIQGAVSRQGRLISDIFPNEVGERNSATTA